ncbi:hypothetical protein HPP92_015175 [Vanilla planifolia]|uniref:Protein ARV n=1 Tax=Vanilla planifolia TaxID=51239 RepID=A0A835QMV1_VANPL|nr:hypothetical protein HPP92_015175 [Vanilla planifolia]
MQDGSELVWTTLNVIVDVLFGNFVFASVLWIWVSILLKLNHNLLRFKEVLFVVLVSSYFKLFLLAMMVWDFPYSVLYIVDIFVLSSNAVALRVLTQLKMSSCIAISFSAHITKFFAYHWLLSLLKCFR